MFVTVDIMSRATLPENPNLAAPRAWSNAEFFDLHLPDGLVLRALVCPLDGEWQWTISTLEQDRGALISVGIAKTAATARCVANAEIAKCLEDGMTWAG
jgi:hypothetical protein